MKSREKKFNFQGQHAWVKTQWVFRENKAKKQNKKQNRS